MDAHLRDRLEKGLSPFDGVALSAANDLPLGSLRALTQAVLGVLESAFPTSPLFSLDDWHEHDGFINSAEPITWPDVRRRLADADAFLWFKTGEFAVAKGIYPKGAQFYLRVVMDEDATPAEGEGRLDVTVPLSLETAVVDAFKRFGVSPLRQDPRIYFTDRAAG